MECEYCHCPVQYKGEQLHYEGCAKPQEEDWVHPSALPDGP